MVQPTSVVDRRQAWGDGGSPYTSSIIVLTCISGLEPILFGTKFASQFS
jgi:hypothetical protein